MQHPVSNNLKQAAETQSQAAITKACQVALHTCLLFGKWTWNLLILENSLEKRCILYSNLAGLACNKTNQCCTSCNLEYTVSNLTCPTSPYILVQKIELGAEHRTLAFCDFFQFLCHVFWGSEASPRWKAMLALVQNAILAEWNELSYFAVWNAKLMMAWENNSHFPHRRRWF